MSAQSAAMAAARPAEPANPADRLARLFDAHHQAVYRLARRLTASADTAADAVQDTFLRAARHLGRVPQGHAAEEACLVRVLINICRDAWRKQQVRQRHVASDSRYTPGTAATDEAQLMARVAVWTALDRLPPKRRAIIILAELDGSSVAAIASLLGVSAITVRWHLSRGRRELRRILAPTTGDTP